MKLANFLGTLLLIVFSSLLGWISLNLLLYFVDGKDPRGFIDVLADENEAGRVAIPSLCPRDLARGEGHSAFNAIRPPEIPVLLGSAPHVWNLYCQEDEGWYGYQSDRFGFNNVDALWDAPIDTVIVGDSFAQGACTPGNLQNYLNPGRATVSLGAGGNGPLLTHAVLREFLRRFPVKHVVWMISANDEGDFETEVLNPALHRYLESPTYTQDYFRTAPLEALARNTVEATRNYLALNAGNIAGNRHHTATWRHIWGGEYFFERWKIMTQPRKKKPVASKHASSPLKYLRLFAQSAKEAKEKGASITFVLLPTGAFWEGSREVSYPDERAFLEKAGMAILDLSPLLRPGLSQVAHKGGKLGHLNSAGYQVLADAIEDRLQSLSKPPAAVIPNGR